jgi:predicted nucleotidyltransferase
MSEIEKIKKKINPILKKHDVGRAAIFGSYARGEQKKKSDIDILIEFNNDASKSLFDLVGLHIDLEEKLKKKVDLVEYCMIFPRLKEKILSEQLIIL